MNSEKSLFFLTLALSCIWVVLDNIWGKKYLQTFLSKLFPFMSDGESKIISKSTEKTKEVFGDFSEDTTEESKEKDKSQGLLFREECTFCDFYCYNYKEMSEHLKKHSDYSKGGKSIA